MDSKDGIPLWEFIKPKRENRIHEIKSLLRFYSEYQDQIDKNQEALDLFITELLYAGYDCLISDDWLDGKESPSEFLGTFKIPPNSRLAALTGLMEAYYSELDVNAEKLSKDFPIILCTRIGRDLHFKRQRLARRETELKEDPVSARIKPLTKKDFHSTDGGLPPVIKKQNERFEEQMMRQLAIEYPHPPLKMSEIMGEVKTGLIKAAIKASKKIARNRNDQPLITKQLSKLKRIRPDLSTDEPRRPGAGKGKHPFYSLPKKDLPKEKAIEKERNQLILEIKEAQAEKAAGNSAAAQKKAYKIIKKYSYEGIEYRDEKGSEKNSEEYSEEELLANLIIGEEYPEDLAWSILQEKYRKEGKILRRNKQLKK